MSDDHRPPIRSGERWLDMAGKPNQAHGGSVCYAYDTFYFAGENKGNASLKSGIWHHGVRCYSSDDLKRTTFDSQVSSVFRHPQKKNLFIAVADRWNMDDVADSRYVWLPLTIENQKISMSWRDSWRIEDFE